MRSMIAKIVGTWARAGYFPQPVIMEIIVALFYVQSCSRYASNPPVKVPSTLKWCGTSPSTRRITGGLLDKPHSALRGRCPITPWIIWMTTRWVPWATTTTSTPTSPSIPNSFIDLCFRSSLCLAVTCRRFSAIFSTSRKCGATRWSRTRFAVA